jgi:AcrR family transcriptional regulator
VAPLTRDEILKAAEDVLRRHGPAKANVVDVARALDVSHGSVYRHFPSKVALREAVTGRWLEQAHAGLAEIAAEDAPRDDRLRRWLHALHAAKRKKALDDPELFATYQALIGETAGVAHQHVREIRGQLTQILGDEATATAVFHATLRFHHPIHAAEWTGEGTHAELDRVIDLLVEGLN